MNNIEEESLRLLKIYELVCALENLEDKKIDIVKQEALDKYGRTLLDLTKEEVNTLSVSAIKEYRWMKKWLFMEISKYTEPTTIYFETLNDLRGKLNEFKTAYYKKHPKEKK